MQLKEALNRLRPKCGNARGPSADGWWNFERCPFSHHTNRWTFGIQPVDGRYRCFACPRGGRLEDIGLAEEIQVPPGTERAILADLGPPPPPEGLPWAPVPPSGALPPPAEKVVAYLESRGVSRDHAAQQGVGYGLEGRWEGRSIHPWYSLGGVLGGWQGRLAVGGDKPRILTTSRTRQDPVSGVSFGDGEFVWGAADGALLGLHSAGERESLLVVTEGPFDQLAVARFCPAVALMGTVLHRAQMQRILAKAPQEVLVGMDPDRPRESLRIAGAFWQAGQAVSVMRWHGYGGDWAGDEGGAATTRAWVEDAIFRGKTEYFPGMAVPD